MTTTTLASADGFALGMRTFEPEGAALGTVVIHGATAVPQRYYARFSEYLAGRGVRVVTYDYRGVGASRPASLRHFEATLTDWVADARAVDRFVRERFDAPIAFIGHSFGGQLIGLADELRETRGALLVGAQLGYHGNWPLPRRATLALLWTSVVPAATAVWGYLPGKVGLGVDLPSGVARQWAEWCMHPDYLMGHEPTARARFGAFDRPVLFYSFRDDDYAPRRAVTSFTRALTSAKLMHRRLGPADLGARAIGHFGFFRPNFADSLWVQAGDYFTRVLSGDAMDEFGDARARAHAEEAELFDFLYHRSEREDAAPPRARAQ